MSQKISTAFYCLSWIRLAKFMDASRIYDAENSVS